MDDEQDIQSFFAFLGRRKLTAIVTAAVILVIALTAVINLSPIYSATTLVMVDDLDRGLPGLVGKNPDAGIEAEALLVETDEVLLRAIDQNDLIFDEAFMSERGMFTRILDMIGQSAPEWLIETEARRHALARLRDALTVERQPGTYLLTISVASTSAERSASLSDAVALAYIETRASAEAENIVAAQSLLAAQLNSARQTMMTQERAYRELVDRMIEDALATSENFHLAALQGEIDRLDAVRREDLGRLESLQRDTSEATFVAPVPFETVGLGDLEAVQGTFSGRQLSVLGQTMSALSDALRATDRELSSKRQELRLAYLDSDLPTDDMTRLFDGQRRTQLARSRYNDVLERSQQLAAETSLRLPASRIVSPAGTTGVESTPRPMPLFALAGLLSLSLGVGAAFLQDSWIGGVTSSERLAAVTGSRLAVQLPRVRRWKNQVSVADRVVFEPEGAFAESIRRLRNALDHRLAASETGAVIAVTSTVADEGKSTTSLALARSYALSGRGVLLIDCDLRHPALHRHLEAATAIGLFETLTATDPVSGLCEALIRDKHTGLVALGGSEQAATPAMEVLSSASFERLLLASRQAFDLVILDSPPIGSVTESLSIAQKSDALVFVVKSGATSERDVWSALLTLSDSLDKDLPLLPVLNQHSAMSTAYYGRTGAVHRQAARH